MGKHAVARLPRQQITVPSTPPIDTPRRLAYSRDEVATLLGCSKGFVDTLIRSGHLAAKRVERRVFITPQAVADFLSS